MRTSGCVHAGGCKPGPLLLPPTLASRARQTCNRELVPVEAFGYFTVKPRFVTKLDRVPRAVPVLQIVCELLEPPKIFFQKCRELPNDSSQPLPEGGR